MNHRGFSLIEMLLYIGITSLMLSVMFSFVLNMTNARAKVQANADIAYNANLIEDRLGDAVRHATAINTGASTFGTDPGVLSLTMADLAVSPTIFSLTANDGIVQVSQAGGAFAPLTTTNVKVTNFTFTNLTSLKDVGIIQLNFTLQTVNNTMRPYDDASATFQTSFRIPLVP